MWEGLSDMFLAIAIEIGLVVIVVALSILIAPWAFKFLDAIADHMGWVGRYSSWVKGL